MHNKRIRHLDYQGYFSVTSLLFHFHLFIVPSVQIKMEKRSGYARLYKGMCVCVCVCACACVRVCVRAVFVYQLFKLKMKLDLKYQVALK